jgi:hypothetical protein
VGKPVIESPIAQFAYFRPNHHQTVFRNLNGSVDVIRADDVAATFGDGGFPLLVEGQDFEGLMREVRAVAADVSIE